MGSVNVAARSRGAGGSALAAAPAAYAAERHVSATSSGASVVVICYELARTTSPATAAGVGVRPALPLDGSDGVGGQTDAVVLAPLK